jgi:hypothetical protein
MKRRPLFLLLSLLCIPILGFSLYAETDRVQPSNPDDKKAQADSLQLQADSLEAQATALERQLDTLGDQNDDFTTGLKREIDKLHDEIMTVRDKIAAAVNDIIKSADSIDDSTPEEPPDHFEPQSEGIDQSGRIEPPEQVEGSSEYPDVGKSRTSFIVALEYTRFDVDPLEHLAQHDRSLTGKQFDFSDNQMLTFGLMWYYSKDNSVRVGNGLYVGYKRFDSDVYRGAKNDTLPGSLPPPDSLATLRVIPTYFGFLCEKAFVYDPVNFFAGIMLGGNLTVVVKEEEEARLVSSFIDDEDFGDDDGGRFSVALSPAIFWDVHGGMAFTLSENIHIGIDGVVRFSYAYEGFGAGFGDFLSVDPGVRVRLTFGKAG